MTQTILFSTPQTNGIHCAGCEQRIGKILRRLRGVKAVEASAQSQLVRVEFDPDEVTVEHLQTKLENAGFAVQQVGEHS